MPTLIRTGRFDRALYPKKLQMGFKRRCPQARLVMLEKSGTWGHLEEPDTVMTLLRARLEPLGDEAPGLARSDLTTHPGPAPAGLARFTRSRLADQR